MKKIEKLKIELLEKAKEKGACVDQYRRAAKCETEEELLKVIHDNLNWCSENEIISNEWLSKFTAKALLKSGVANTGLKNTGFANSGDWNSGYRNSGDSNSGYSNSGYRNSGYRNSGDRNSGDWNSGYRNSGYRNSGDWNSGDWNSGYRNSGYRNSGDSNSGNRNSGDSNSGYRNSGNWNSGNWNSGDSNSGYRNSGAFCLDNNPKVFLFDKQAKMTVREWEESRAYDLMLRLLNPNMWIYSSEMTSAEKEEYPEHETTGGYLKEIGLKSAWANMWGNLSDDDKKAFTDLENFDKDKFKEITGIEL
jgi:hypothetical protein